jgi:arsenite methyltransferase
MKHSDAIVYLTENENGLDREVLREAIRAEYHFVATSPEQGFHYHTGRSLIPVVGYKEEWLTGIPESTIASFAGTGNPFSLGEIHAGEHVLDIGCGAGIDSLIASKKTGSAGMVIGVDMTPAMIRKAEKAARMMERYNVHFRQGFAEALPVDDGWADVIISNGVLNLTPDKRIVFAEMARVLKPGGRLQIADILITSPVPESSKKRADLWTGCIAGALMKEELEELVMEAGFRRPEITWWADVYEGAPQSSSARRYGTIGINFRSVKQYATVE